jgi:disulfide bond formation protein DsbB
MSRLPQSASLDSTSPANGVGVTLLALVLALIAVVGSLYLSMGLKLIGCPLCFYQRSFALGVFGVLSLGLLTTTGRSGVASLLALPMALGGAGVAGFHVYLEGSGQLECPLGVFQVGTAPKQSLVALSLLSLALLAEVTRAGRQRYYDWTKLAPALVLGIFFAAACILSAPPLDPTPTKEYPEGAIQKCRPPFKGS